MIHPLVLSVLGCVLGLLTGFFGVGGGFFITPALNVLGLPMAFAIGTSLAAIVGNALLGTLQHYRLGSVDSKLGIVMGVCGLPGIELGKRLVIHLEKLDLVGNYVRGAYIFILLLISLLMLRESYSSFERGKKHHHDETGGIEKERVSLADRIQRIGIPPALSFPRSGIKSISFWVVFAIGMTLGFFSGFMGIGGGFVGLPMLIYLIGLPTHVAVGTSLVTVFIISSYGTLTYAMVGKVQWTAVFIILAGSLVSTQFGARVTKYATGMRLRALFALLLLFIALSVLMKEFGWDRVSMYVLGGVACLLSVAIIIVWAKNYCRRKPI